MKYQDFMIEVSQQAADEAFRYAAGVPADKLEWVPMAEARTVLDQCQEMAKSPDWAVEILKNKAFPAVGEAELAEFAEEKSSWTTVEECKRICNENLQKMFAYFKTIPDSELDTMIWLPFNGGRDHSVKEIMDYPRWNFNYHLGQIAYIQTLYGDKGYY